MRIDLRPVDGVDVGQRRFHLRSVAGRIRRRDLAQLEVDATGRAPPPAGAPQRKQTKRGEPVERAHRTSIAAAPPGSIGTEDPGRQVLRPSCFLRVQTTMGAMLVAGGDGRAALLRVLEGPSTAARRRGDRSGRQHRRRLLPGVPRGTTPARLETPGRTRGHAVAAATRRGDSRTRGLPVARGDWSRSSSRAPADRSGARGSPRVEWPGRRGPSPLCRRRHGRQAVICG